MEHPQHAFFRACFSGRLDLVKNFAGILNVVTTKTIHGFSGLHLAVLGNRMRNKERQKYQGKNDSEQHLGKSGHLEVIEWFTQSFPGTNVMLTKNNISPLDLAAVTNDVEALKILMRPCTNSVLQPHQRKFINKQTWGAIHKNSKKNGVGGPLFWADQAMAVHSKNLLEEFVQNTKTKNVFVDNIGSVESSSEEYSEENSSENSSSDEESSENSQQDSEKKPDPSLVSRRPKEQTDSFKQIHNRVLLYCLSGNEHEIHKIFKDDIFDVHATDDLSRTCLFYAVIGGHPSLVRFLMSQDPALVTKRQYDNVSVIDFAVATDSVEILRILTQHQSWWCTRMIQLVRSPPFRAIPAPLPLAIACGAIGSLSEIQNILKKIEFSLEEKKEKHKQNENQVERKNSVENIENDAQDEDGTVTQSDYENPSKTGRTPFSKKPRDDISELESFLKQTQEELESSQEGNDSGEKSEQSKLKQKNVRFC